MTSAHHLNVVGEAGEDEAGDDEDHHEEPKLRDALAESVDDGLEAPGVPGKYFNTSDVNERIDYKKVIYRGKEN